MNNAKTIENFLSKEECEYLINVSIESNLWESGGNAFWDNRIINYYKMINYNEKAASIMLDANVRCSQEIKKQYNLDKDVYPDTLQVVRWFPGMEQHPHADDMSNTDIAGFDHRMFGTVLYLNNNYSGGHTFYPNFDFEIVPKQGTLAMHPGDPEHLHGVTKIESGIRYTIASFWTYEKGKSYVWPVSK
jgi:prolyl 4-hydroxylase